MQAVVIAVVGYTASRRAGMRRSAAAMLAAATLALGAVVMVLKVLLGH